MLFGSPVQNIVDYNWLKVLFYKLVTNVKKELKESSPDYNEWNLGAVMYCICKFGVIAGISSVNCPGVT